jgi:hypothetical protein
MESVALLFALACADPGEKPDADSVAPVDTADSTPDTGTAVTDTGIVEPTELCPEPVAVEGNVAMRSIDDVATFCVAEQVIARGDVWVVADSGIEAITVPCLCAVEGGLQVNGGATLVSAEFPRLTRVVVVGTETLQTLDGLSTLRTIRIGLHLSGNARLSSIEGLGGVEGFDGVIDIDGSDVLPTLDGLPVSPRMEAVGIDGNPSLTDISALSGLTGVDDYLSISGNGLTDLSALSGVSSVRSLWIGEPITSLAPFSRVTDIPDHLYLWDTAVSDLTELSLARVGSLDIRGNTEMVDLRGLEGVKFDDLYVYGQPRLHSIDGLTVPATLPGGLSVGGSPELADVSALAGITAVGGGMSITGSSRLSDLTGLETLASVGGWFGVADQSALADIRALASLREVGSSLYLMDLPALVDLAPLSGLRSIGGVLEIDNVPTTSLEAFGQLDLVNKLYVVNTRVTDLHGLDQLETVEFDLVLSDNPDLLTLSGLESVRFVGGTLEISRNPLLYDVSALIGVRDIDGDFRVIDNPSLLTADVEALLDAIRPEVIDGEIVIEGNLH